MNNIAKSLDVLRRHKHIGLMTHVVIGYPKNTEELVKTMVANGTDIIELQIPFSDPLADGPTIMKACEKALKNDVHVADVFTLVKKLRKDIHIPFLLMCYYNTVFHYGVEKFCNDAKLAGIDGLIVPDMPFDAEKEEHFYALAEKYDLTTIHVISPASTDERLKKLSEYVTGFVYCTAHQGITGARGKLDSNIKNYLRRVKKYISLPIAVGFGIATPDHVASLVGQADIAVVGSKILDIINASKNYKKDVGDFLKSLNMVE